MSPPDFPLTGRTSAQPNLSERGERLARLPRFVVYGQAMELPVISPMEQRAAQSCRSEGCGSGTVTDVAEIGPSERARLIRRAFVLEWLTIAWMVVEAGVSLFAAWSAGSLLLAAFGLDSLIEIASAGVLVWRLAIELRRGQQFSERAEKFASRVAGALLFALTAYIVVSAGWTLWTGRTGTFSWPGFLVALLAIPAMRYLALRKLRLADQIGSRALRADAMEAVTCGWLSFAVVIGLGAEWALGFWWIDPIASLAIVGLLIREGREAWSGDPCACCS